MSQATDKQKLESIVDVIYVARQHFESKEASECEQLIIEKLEAFKR